MEQWKSYSRCVDGSKHIFRLSLMDSRSILMAEMQYYIKTTIFDGRTKNNQNKNHILIPKQSKEA